VEKAGPYARRRSGMQKLGSMLPLSAVYPSSRVRTLGALDTLLKRCLFLIVLLTLFTAVSADSDESTRRAEILAFNLLPVTNSTRNGAFEVSLGEDGQKVTFLASLYTISDAMMEVPIAALCATSQEGWNPISHPTAGTVVVVGTSKAQGTSSARTGQVVVRWKIGPASDTNATVGLTLRKGRGSDANNVTVIECE